MPAVNQQGIKIMEEEAPGVKPKEETSMTLLERVRFHADSVVRLTTFLEVANIPPKVASEELITAIAKSKTEHQQILTNCLRELREKGVTLEELQSYLKLK